MKVKNISKHNFCHSSLDEAYKLQMIILKPNEIADIPDEVAEKWIKTKQVIEYVEPKDVNELKNENAQLKKQLDKLYGEQKSANKSKSKSKSGKKAK